MIVANLTQPPLPLPGDLCLRRLSRPGRGLAPTPTRLALPAFPMSPVPPALPLCKIRALPTHSESTLLQVFIPRHFNSFISNTYKKLGESPLLAAPRFSNSSPLPQLVTPPPICPSERSEEPAVSSFRRLVFASLRRYFAFPWIWAHTRTPATPIPSSVYFTTLCIPGGWRLPPLRTSLLPIPCIATSLTSLLPYFFMSFHRHISPKPFPLLTTHCSLLASTLPTRLTKPHPSFNVKCLSDTQKEQ